MPRSFSKEEQEKIRKKLIEIGKELFYSIGYKETSVKEIATQAGISSGSFYLFFESKEDLFMNIYFEQNQQVSKDIMQTVDMTQRPKDITKEVLSKLDANVRPSTIMGSLGSMNDFIHIVSKLKEEQKLTARRESYKQFIPLVTKWQDEGILKKIEPDMILTLFDSIFYIKMHKKDIGEQYFPQLIKYLFEFIIEGIFENGGDKK